MKRYDHSEAALMLRHHLKLCDKAPLGYSCHGRDQYRECA
jgi:hypothetical protein